MRDMTHDIAFAWRNALKRPATSLLIVVTLALGIGANTAIFSMTWHVLLAPLPYVDGERLVTLEQHAAGGSRMNFGWSYPTVRDFREQTTVFAELLEYNQFALTFVGRGEPYYGYAGIVTGSFFETLGVRPELGRLFGADDDRLGAEPVILLSHDFWSSKFNEDPGVIGETLEIQHSIYRIVGVLPRMPGYPHANDVWIPIESDPYTLALGPGPVRDNRNAGVIARVIGKLREGVTLQEAARDTEVIASRLAATYPDVYPEGYAVGVAALKDVMTRDAAVTIVLLMALAVFVVLIASANVANLNLARTMARNQELAVREAVGASPRRIARQLLTESLILAVAGGLLGVVVAWPCLQLLSGFAARYTPLASEVRMDGMVLAFSCGLALVAGVLGSAASIFGERDINRTLKEGSDKVTTSATGARKRNALLAVQFGLAFVVLTVSALIVLSLWRLNRQDTGFNMDQVLAVNMILNVDLSERLQIEQKMRSFTRDALAAINAIPEVGEAAVRTGAPLLQEMAGATEFQFDVDGWSGATGEGGPAATITMVSENYFAMMQIPFVQGRFFAATDDADAPIVVMVNESFARRFFPDGKATDGNIRLNGWNDWSPVVGVVADVRSQNLDEVEGPVVYFSYWQFAVEGVTLYVKTAANPAAVAESITRAVHALDPRQSVRIQPLGEVKSEWLAPARLRATLIGLFGVLALMVTLSGVVGAISYNVSQRVREIGVHMAVGASPSSVVRLFIWNGIKVYATGLLLGLVLMVLAAPFLQPLLYQTAAMDAPVYLLSAFVLTLAVLGAIYVPARKAGALSPTLALRAE